MKFGFALMQFCQMCPLQCGRHVWKILCTPVVKVVFVTNFHGAGATGDVESANRAMGQHVGLLEDSDHRRLTVCRFSGLRNYALVVDEAAVEGPCVKRHVIPQLSEGWVRIRIAPSLIAQRLVANHDIEVDRFPFPLAERTMRGRS